MRDMGIFDEFIQPLNPEPVEITLKEQVYLAIEKKIFYNCLCEKTRFRIKGLDADDLAQEVRIRMYRELPSIMKKIDNTKNIEGYVATRVKWRIRDIWRKYSKSSDVFYSEKCEILSLLDNDQEK